LKAALKLNNIILTILLQAQVVLNYDFPLYKADYIHRCGRVGRIDSKAKGKVVNFVNGPAEIKVVQAIEVTD
jgi:ATP-dependent RNA helicase DDX28